MCVALAAALPCAAQDVSDADWVAKQFEQDREVLAMAALRRPEAAMLSLSHDTEELAKLMDKLANQPKGQKTLLTPPFRVTDKGTWFVVQGQLDLVSHLRGTSNAYAWDYVLKDKDGRQTDPDKSGNEAHFCWEQPVVAPAPGIVAKVANDFEDHGPSEVPREGGNHVIIDHLNGEASALWHFKQGSIVVTPGQRVRRGQLLGLCGDSGNSLYPHIHQQLDRWDSKAQKRKAAPAVLSMYLSGKDAEKIRVGKSPRRGEYVTPLRTSVTVVMPQEGGEP